MGKPRILLLTPWAPYPYDGGSKRIWSLCRELRSRFDFTLLTFLPRSEGPKAAADDLLREHRWLRPVFDRVVWVDRRGEAESTDATLPEDVRRFASPAMERALHHEIERERPAVLHVEYDLMAPYGALVDGVPKVLTQHDVGTISFFQSYFREMAGWRKLTRVGPWLRRVAFERRAMRGFDRLVVLTKPDARRLSWIAPSGKIRVCPTGVDARYYEGARPGPETPAIVFVGHYPHFPNEDAVLFFARAIWPRIKAARPDARFFAVGSSPTPAVRELARQPGVVVTGTVEDVKPYLERASVFVAPLRMGQGIKGKILEAFAAGVPVVATSRAADGLDGVTSRELLVEDRPAAFARRVLELLGNPEMGRAYGEAGRRAARSGWDWPVLAGRVGDVYEELIAREAVAETEKVA